MAVSYNEDVRVGNSTFHVQTEYYRKSGKVVSNIFKDGLAVKRLEREVSEESDVDSAVGEFHRYVVERLKGGIKKKEKQELPEGRFYLPEEVEHELLQTLYPYFGVASSLVVDEAVSSSSTVDEFLESLLEGLPENIREALAEKLKPLLYSLSSNLAEPVREAAVETKFEIDEERKERILQALSDFFGIMALPVLEEALEEWSGTEYQELVDLIVNHVEDEKEREELRRRLMFL